LKSNAALQYHPEGFETAGPKPMGRQAAGQGLLRGFVAHADVDAHVGYGAAESLAKPFASAVGAAGGTLPVAWATAMTPEPLFRTGALHLAGPGLPEAAWARRGLGQARYSLTGVTHTVASDRAMSSIVGMLAAPVQSWDALICTSRSVRAMVDVLLEDQAAYLRARFGENAVITRPQLPIIPLGVRVQDFGPDEALRARFRARLQIADTDVLVLMAGRLSFHAKAHPHPMYMALQRAAETTGVRSHLLLASWFANAGQERVFREGAAELCPDVTLHVVDGRLPGVWESVWRAADLYTLLADNIQESFGLAPVEAMAAGLPVVGADWDGLRDTIEPGVTGYLASTLIPPPGAGEALARAHAAEALTYDQYVGGVAQSTSVDIAEAADAYARLLSDRALRLRMGEAGRARARREYDWSVVIGAYQALWGELAGRRAKDAVSAAPAPGQPADPARSDPFRHFAAHATSSLQPDDVAEPTPDLPARAAALLARDGAAVVPGVLHGGAALAIFARRLAGGGPLGDALSGPDRARNARTLVWLVKHGVLRCGARADWPQANTRKKATNSL
jgi:glycosyltransferase involved in cell wall biosynthesis